MRRLPPLSAIEAFVHVARAGLIKAAAEELALSSPALSRRIQTLERFMGRSLFDRRRQAMVLNADGERLLGQLAPALDAMSDAIEATTSGVGVMRLRLSVLSLFASQQLLPKLPDLRRRHPELHLDVDTAAHGASRLGEGIDAAIILTESVDPAYYSVRLNRNRVFAIAARAMVEGDDPITDPRQLASQTILIHRDMPTTFEIWREGMGHPHLEPAAIDHFDSGALMLEAAAQGLGIAFMFESHFEDARDPRIVNLFGRAVDSGYSYWFVCRPRALSQRPVKLFHDWLVEAFGAGQQASTSSA